MVPVDMGLGCGCREGWGGKHLPEPPEGAASWTLGSGMLVLRTLASRVVKGHGEFQPFTWERFLAAGWKAELQLLRAELTLGFWQVVASGVGEGG